MASVKIALFDVKPYDQEFFSKVNSRPEYGFDIHYLPGRLNLDTVPAIEGFDTACIFVNDNVDIPVIDKLYSYGIKLLALRSAGYNNVDLKYIFGKIHAVRVPAYSPYAVAEHAIALMMALNRKTHKAYYRTRDNNFTLTSLLGFDMHGKTAGVIGTGKIGKGVMDILRGFGMRILAYDKYPDLEYAQRNNVEYTELDTIYRESDIITLHCPLTPENVHMINSENIGKMKTGVMIINTGRGKLIDTKDLIAGLKTRKIGSAGLDVYEEEEEYFFEDFSAEAISDDVLARLMTFPNVIVTAHQAFFTREAMETIAETTLENIRLFFKEGKLPNEICYKCTDGKCTKQTPGKCF
jgi:D-lactate dehydrogenase